MLLPQQVKKIQENAALIDEKPDGDGAFDFYY